MRFKDKTALEYSLIIYCRENILVFIIFLKHLPERLWKFLYNFRSELHQTITFKIVNKRIVILTVKIINIVYVCRLTFFTPVISELVVHVVVIHLKNDNTAKIKNSWYLRKKKINCRLKIFTLFKKCVCKWSDIPVFMRVFINYISYALVYNSCIKYFGIHKMRYFRIEKTGTLLCPFCKHQCFICIVKQLIILVRIKCIYYPDCTGNTYILVRSCIDTVYALAYGRTEWLHIWLVGIFGEHHEFVTAESYNNIGRTHYWRKFFGHFFKHGVAEFPSIEIVYLKEIINVNYTESTKFTLRFDLKILFYKFLPAFSRIQSGKPVFSGLCIFFFGFRDLRFLIAYSDNHLDLACINWIIKFKFSVTRNSLYRSVLKYNRVSETKISILSNTISYGNKIFVISVSWNKTAHIQTNVYVVLTEPGNFTKTITYAYDLEVIIDIDLKTCIAFRFYY